MDKGIQGKTRIGRGVGPEQTSLKGRYPLVPEGARTRVQEGIQRDEADSLGLDEKV